MYWLKSIACNNGQSKRGPQHCASNAIQHSWRKDMATKRKFTIEEARVIGGQLGIHQGDFNFEEFRRGLEVELEHGLRDPETNVTNDDVLLTGKIAWAHLKEFPDYYTRLDKLEAEADEFWAAQRSQPARS
jgi:hypothetical protein